MIASLSQSDPKVSQTVLIAGFVAFSGAAFFLHPLALLLFVCLVSVVTPTNDFKWLFLAAAGVLFTILNVSKQLDGDLVNYVTLQDYVSAKPVFVLFDKDELQLISGTYRLTEIGFYAPLWVMCQVLLDSKLAVAIAATLGIYVPTFLALARIGEFEKWTKGQILGVGLFTFFAGINFIQSTHLIRQYISSALLFYAFALVLSRRNKWAILIALYACSVHNGTALLIPTMAAGCWLFRYRPGVKLGLLGVCIRIVPMLALLAVTIVVVPLLQGGFLQEIPNIRAGHFIVVGVFFLLAHIAIEKQQLRLNSLYYARIAYLLIYTISLGFYVLGLPLYALRYFAYLEWLYGLMVGAIMFTWFRSRPALQMYARFGVSLVAIAILVARIGVAEWNYGPGDNYLLSWDFFQVAQLVSR